MSARPAQHERRTQALLAVAVLLLTAILVVLIAGSGTRRAGTGSGVAATQARAVDPFSADDLAGDDNVVVRAGARQAVTVHADDNLLGRVTTRVRSGTLVIDTTPGNLEAKRPMWVEVRLPKLDGVVLEGAGNISVSGIRAPRLIITLAGSGNIEASGTASRLDVTIGGEGTALLRGLVARDARSTIGGDGTIMLTATRSLAARISGNGTILYRGDPPHVTQSITGSGTIQAG